MFWFQKPETPQNTIIMKKQFLFMAATLFAAFLFFGSTVSAQWVPGAGVIYTFDDVGIGVSDPIEKLHVNGNLQLGQSGRIFVLRTDQTKHEIFTMDGNNDVFINRSSLNIAEGLPSILAFAIGEARRFEIRNANNVRLFRVNESNGNVGVGNINPQRKLEVDGDILIGKGGRLFVRRQDNSQHEMFQMDANDDIIINRSSLTVGGGMQSNVIFGIGDGGFLDFRNASNERLLRLEEATGKMYLGGKLTATEIEVKLDVWPDFVFADDYQLKSLYEVENFIRVNRHLPNVPSEAEVLENGVNVGEISSTLLQKIEELTLYVIELNKQNDELKLRIQALEK